MKLANGLFVDFGTSEFVESHKPTVVKDNRVGENPSENPEFIKVIVGFLVYTTDDGIIHPLDINSVYIDGDDIDIRLSLLPPPDALHKHIGTFVETEDSYPRNVRVFLEWFPFRKL